MPQDFYDKIRETKLRAEQDTKDKAFQMKLWKENEAKAFREAGPRFDRPTSKIKVKARELTRTLRGVSIELKQESKSHCKTCEVNICYSRSNIDRWKKGTGIWMELTSYDPPDGSPTMISDFKLKAHPANAHSVRNVSEENILKQCESRLQELILLLVREHPECAK